MFAPRDQIISLPHPGLRQRSQKIRVITPAIRQLVSDMQSAVLDWEAHREHEVGVALAAVQINQLKRIVVIRHNFDDKNDHSFDVLINPIITKLQGKIEEDFEGCLSIKDIYGKVPRYTAVKVRALGLDGREFRLTADGFLARILQHEIDHINGIVFVDHIKDHPEAFFRLNDQGSLEPLEDLPETDDSSPAKVMSTAGEETKG